MYSKTLIFFVVFSIYSSIASATNNSYLPFSGKKIPPKTGQPININLNNAKKITTPTPLTLLGGSNSDPAILINSGTSVISRPTSQTTTNRAIGGVLYDNFYTYFQTVYHWAGTPQGVAGTTVSGRNYEALEAWIYYYKSAYRSVLNALNYRDGLMVYMIRIFIGSKTNPKYNNFEAAMQKIIQPGSSTNITVKNSFEWFHDFPSNISYFAYPGAYENKTTNSAYYCTTTIVQYLSSTQYLSTKQFTNTFPKLQGSNGKKLTNEAQQYPQGGRPVVCANGVNKISSTTRVPLNFNL